jgi:hypothetical protein
MQSLLTPYFIQICCKITKKYAFMQKKCKKIWSYQKKAVPLHPLFEKQRSA